MIHLGLFYGMNGNHSVSKTIPKVSIKDCHENHINAYPNLYVIPLKCRKGHDHRKMMFFIENTKRFSYTNTINANNYQNFLDSITVHGILLGSSNMSNTTYYGGSTGIADKGEADVLMFTDDDFAKFVQSRDFESESIILFRSIHPDHLNAPKYLKRILEDFLQGTLLEEK